MPKEEKTVDIDTTGPGAEINIEEKKEKEEVEVVEPVKEEPVEEKKEEVEEKQEASDEKPVEEKKELEEYSEGVQRRISKLTKKWREAERQKEAAVDFARGGQAELTELRTRLTKLEPSYVTAIESKVASGLQAAQAKLARARDAGDIATEVEAQKDIAKLGVEEARVASLKARQAEAREKEVKTPTLDQAIAPQAPVDPKAEDWAANNSWFGKDNAMTYTAFDLHKKLTEEEGFDPNSPEYYAEIDKRIRVDFPHKFGNTKSQESTKPTQTVASATRSVKPGRQTVRLTSSQVVIAKKLGVPLEEYAKQLKLTKEA